MAERHLSEAEWKVMNAVWGNAPTTARRVLQATEDETGWKYSTVKTMLDRLVDKGVLSAELEGITTVYEPNVSCEDARRGAMQALADRAFGGAVGSMMHFLVENERLPRGERKRLAELLRVERRRRDA